MKIHYTLRRLTAITVLFMLYISSVKENRFVIAQEKFFLGNDPVQNIGLVAAGAALFGTGVAAGHLLANAFNSGIFIF